MVIIRIIIKKYYYRQHCGEAYVQGLMDGEAMELLKGDGCEARNFTFCWNKINSRGQLLVAYSHGFIINDFKHSVMHMSSQVLSIIMGWHSHTSWIETEALPMLAYSLSSSLNILLQMILQFSSFYTSYFMGLLFTRISFFFPIPPQICKLVLAVLI